MPRRQERFFNSINGSRDDDVVASSSHAPMREDHDG